MDTGEGEGGAVQTYTLRGGHALYHCVKRLLTQPAQTHLLLPMCVCQSVCVCEKHVTVFSAQQARKESPQSRFL